MAIRIAAAVVGLLLAGAAHAATISGIIIRGQGVVSLSIPGTVNGSPVSPPVGTPFELTAKVFFGPGIVPSNATDTFVCCGLQSIERFEVSLSGVGKFSSLDEYNGSTVEFRDGKPTGFFLGAPLNSPGQGGYISATDFQYTRSIPPICDVGGNCLDSTFVLGSIIVSGFEVRMNNVPEPAQWGMMLLGFALVGGRSRLSRGPSRATRDTSSG